MLPQRENRSASQPGLPLPRISTARKATAKFQNGEPGAVPPKTRNDSTHIASVHDPLDTSIPFLLRRTSRCFRLGIQNRLRQYDLGFSHWFFLRALWIGDGITQRELCKRIEAPEPAAVAALRVLESKGYVRRSRDQDNRRKILVFITPKGYALREKLLPHAMELANIGVKGISKREQELLRSLLNKIHDNMVSGLRAELIDVED